MKENLYDQIAHNYDLTHADLTADIPFVLQLAQAAGGPVLELGCGSGRLLLPLAQAGFAVTGLDNSATMLELARAKLTQAAAGVKARVTLMAADMTDFAADGRFPLIIIPYNTFMHLDSAQAAAALKRVRAHLAADGRCFIDLANPFVVADTPEDALLSLESALIDQETGELLVHLAANKVDTAGQVLHITWIYDRSPLAGGPVQRTVVQAAYHYRYPHQMELLLQDAGLPAISFHGDYDDSPFHENSERLLILAGF